jgi:hypothetical protein
MLKRILVGVLCVSLIIGISLANAKTTGGKKMNGEIRKELETAYNSLRKSISDKNYAEFSKLLEPAKDGMKVPPKEKMSDEAWEGILDTFEDLANAKFITVKTKGDWAGYYIQTYVDDPNYLTIDLIKFHKVDGKWKVSGSRFGSSISKEAGADQNKAILNEIDSNQGFALP